jgi:RimJ/RimL family protein N-acetyltransferase
MNIHFDKATKANIGTIFSWLAQDFIMEFWDNTQAHKDDIINFIEGRKTPSTYADGKYVYWIASFNNEPFAMLMTIQETQEDNIGEEKLSRLSHTGTSYGIDYMIGNPKFFGIGYGAKTLSEFIDFFRTSFDPKADTFLIDPDTSNPKAKHVYMQAGFEHVCDFMMKGDVSGAGKIHHLLVRKFDPETTIRSATISDIESMVSLSKTKRLEYEKAQPQFWRYAGENGDNAQKEWFKELLEDKNHLMFIAQGDTQEILGFIIGKLMRAPEVYNPRGLTLMIDDFCVESEELWESVGTQLVKAIKKEGKAKGAAQILVVCGAHDAPKRKFLQDQKLSIASEWFVGGIT